MHVRLVLLICLVTLNSLAASTSASSNASLHRDPAEILLRISISRFGTSGDGVRVDAPAGARLSDPFDSFLAGGPANWQFSLRDGAVVAEGPNHKVVATGPVLRVIQAPDFAPVSVSGIRRTTRYRGALEFREAPDQRGRLMVLNELPLEDYLRGVIPMEMNPSAPVEALKAQAVAARTFALKARERYTAKGFDLTDDTACQVYGGADAECPQTDAAVVATAGLILRRNKAIIWADYYDDCGGVTAPGEDANDYPPSVKDSPADGAAEYCAGGKHHNWTLILTPDQVQSLLAPLERDRRYSGVFHSMGRLSMIRITRMDESGRANEVEIADANGVKLNLKGSHLRMLAGYDRLKSTRFTVSRESDGFVFRGTGYGHGHGMCQCGAIGMAGAPYKKSFREILDHYYPGAEITTLQETVNGGR